jgi:hypothetical protein
MFAPDQHDVVLALLSEIRAEQANHSAAFDRIEARFDRFDRSLNAMLKDMRVAMREFSR